MKSDELRSLETVYAQRNGSVAKTYVFVCVRGILMLRYAVRRIAGLIPTLLVIVTAAFFIVRLAPGGPFDQEQTLSREVRANLDRHTAGSADRRSVRQIFACVGAWRLRSVLQAT